MICIPSQFPLNSPLRKTLTGLRGFSDKVTPVSLIVEGKFGRYQKDGLNWGKIWSLIASHSNLDPLKRCIDAGVGTAYSNPCFELWLILHDCDMDSPLTRHEAQHICRERSLFTDSSKKRPVRVDEAQALLAEDRADKQLQKRIEESLRYGPPATNVGSLTQILRSSGKAES